jgi:hypothetical protein
MHFAFLISLALCAMSSENRGTSSLLPDGFGRVVPAPGVYTKYVQELLNGSGVPSAL